MVIKKRGCATGMYRIFIVEDDAVIARAVAEHLRGWGCAVECAADFRDVLTELTAFQPHLVLMDIGLPHLNGYHWCQALRQVSKVPVIFLSSASDDMNVLTALSLGGDDFIAKPFDLNILTAKVRAMLRRTYDFAAATDLIEAGGVTLNRAESAAYVDGKRLELTPNEYRVLLILLEGRGRVVARETLMERLWQTDCFVDENTLTVNISRLRRKLEAAGIDNLIRTRKGAGYIVE